MWQIPKKVSLVSGHAEGETELSTFDKALLAAGVGEANLIQVSSILPRGVEFVAMPQFVAGLLLPAAFQFIISHRPGEVITATIAIGLPQNPAESGVIVEHTVSGDTALGEAKAREMVEELFAARQRKLGEIRVISSEHKVVKLGCAIALAVFWPD
ncbi:MAG: pyruvoyl-dependent arginine decarboxylase [Dehalococcoidales bacterium]|nr:pyruvoyl-dependent arginine decarboxylase [Dehalococcoidales bacterium]